MPELDALLRIAREAGEHILRVYRQDFQVNQKNDQSPVTEADMAAHHHILDELTRLTPEIPVLSEESAEQVGPERMDWQRYWLVDPLDGTREFIKRNDEFTVNIALIDNGIPVLGVVHAPALDTSWFGARDLGAWRLDGEGRRTRLQVETPPTDRAWRVVGSRSHATPALQGFVDQLGNAQLLSIGSSLKLCMVAEGKADLYPRLGPTSEWDTAAAQAVVEAAGGLVLSWPDLQPLRCNRNPDSLLNPDFIVCSQIRPDWARLATGT